MDRADLRPPVRGDEFGELAALRPRKGEIQAVGDAALEHGEMVGQRQHRLHHVQIVHPRRIHLRQGRGEKIRLLLIVAFDRHAVAGLDDCLEQLRGEIGRADFSARAAERGGPREAGGAICSAS